MVQQRLGLLPPVVSIHFHGLWFCVIAKLHRKGGEGFKGQEHIQALRDFSTTWPESLQVVEIPRASAQA